MLLLNILTHLLCSVILIEQHKNNIKRDHREIKFENIYDLGKPLINTCTILMKIKIRYIDLYIERGINI